MKIKIFNQIGIVCLMGALAAGCTDNYDNMNTDPTGITDGNPAYILPYMQEWGTRVGSWEYQVGDNLHTNLYAQYFANSASYFTSDSYTYNSAWVKDGFWNSYYVGVLKQMRAIDKIADENPDYENIRQMARIFTARCTAQLTDIFGDIPYTEAALGNSNARYDSSRAFMPTSSNSSPRHRHILLSIKTMLP